MFEARSIVNAPMSLVDPAERLARPCGPGHGQQSIARGIEHPLLVIAMTADGDRPHEAGVIAPVDTREFHGELLHGIELAQAGRIADQEGPLPGTQYWA